MVVVEVVLLDGTTFCLDLRREPTRFFIRLFIDDMKRQEERCIDKDDRLQRKRKCKQR